MLGFVIPCSRRLIHEQLKQSTIVNFFEFRDCSQVLRSHSLEPIVDDIIDRIGRLVVGLVAGGAEHVDHIFRDSVVVPLAGLNAAVGAQVPELGVVLLSFGGDDIVVDRQLAPLECERLGPLLAERRKVDQVDAVLRVPHNVENVCKLKSLVTDPSLPESESARLQSNSANLGLMCSLKSVTMSFTMLFFWEQMYWWYCGQSLGEMPTMHLLRTKHRNSVPG